MSEAPESLRGGGRLEDPNEGALGAIEGGALLKRLFKAALCALQEEDLRLRNAFDQAAPGYREMYQAKGLPGPAANEGLTYWLFETALVYVIFKAWIPLAHTVWEGSYPRLKNKKLDLRVNPAAGDLGVPWGFEAKWWPNSNKAKTNPVLKDAAKLLFDSALKERFLLTFWYSPMTYWQCDHDEVARVCDVPGLIPGHEKAKLERLYFGAFPTLVGPRDQHNAPAPHYFAFCALRVRSS